MEETGKKSTGKYFIFSIVLLISVYIGGTLGSRSTTTNDIRDATEETVIKGISENFNISSSDIEVKEYFLVHESDNIYTGLLTTRCNGMTQTFDVKITWDQGYFSNSKFIVDWKLIKER